MAMVYKKKEERSKGVVVYRRLDLREIEQGKWEEELNTIAPVDHLAYSPDRYDHETAKQGALPLLDLWVIDLHAVSDTDLDYHCDMFESLMANGLGTISLGSYHGPYVMRKRVENIKRQFAMIRDMIKNNQTEVRL